MGRRLEICASTIGATDQVLSFIRGKGVYRARRASKREDTRDVGAGRDHVNLRDTSGDCLIRKQL